MGECKWDDHLMGPPVITELVEQKTDRVLRSLPDRGKNWTVHYAFFARSDFTNAARAEAAKAHSVLVDLEQMERDLAE